MVNLMIPGFAKCGTTSLYYYLRQHPEIYFSTAKEIHFFDSDENFSKGASWYFDFFPGFLEGVPYCAEATPAYISKSSLVIPRIKKIIGNDIKFLVVVRNPVDRAWSHYMHMVRNGREESEFSMALEKEASRVECSEGWYGYFKDGLYAENLQPWFEAFGAKNFLVIDQGNLLETPVVILDEIFDFLSIAPFDINVTKKYNAQSKLRSKAFHSFLKRPPSLMKTLYRATLKKIISDPKKKQIMLMLKEANLKNINEKCPADIRLSLRAKYLEDIEKLEEMTSRKYSEWKK